MTEVRVPQSFTTLLFQKEDGSLVRPGAVFLLRRVFSLSLPPTELNGCLQESRSSLLFLHRFFATSSQSARGGQGSRNNLNPTLPRLLARG